MIEEHIDGLGSASDAATEVEDDLIIRARALIDQGAFADAEAVYRELIFRGTTQAKVFSSLAVICGLDGRLTERLQLLEQARLFDENYPECQLNLGVAYHEMGRLAEAQACYQKALALNDQLINAYSNLGILQMSQGAIPAAIESFSKGLSLQPDHELMLLNYGMAMQLAGRADEAILHYLQVVPSYPESPRLLFLIGRALDAIGQTHQAIDLYRKSLELEDKYADVFYHLGLSLSALGDLDPAIDCYRRAVELEPQTAEALGNLALGYCKLGRLEEAISTVKETIAAHPGNHHLHQNLQFYYSISGVHCVSDALNAARSFWSMVRAEATANPPAAAFSIPAREDWRIHIGILSAEIGVHCVSQFIESFLRHYNRGSFRVELISPSIHYQQRAEELAKQADGILSLQGLNASTARQALLERNFDILVDTSGFTAGTALELLAQRCAPIQCHYIGYHASTGLDTIDYFIGDEETTPAEFAWQFSETLWPLPRPWLASTPFELLPMAEPLATRPGPVLGSFNQLTKVREDTLRFWAAALMALPSSVLLLKDRLTASTQVRQRIEATLAGHGVDPERLLYLSLSGSWQEHMTCYNMIDIALDTTPWSSATTGFDALGMGVPLVAIRGNKSSARMGSALVQGVGHPEWIAETPAEFASVVKQLGTNYLHHRHEKYDFQQQVLNGPLYDGSDLTHHLEAAFWNMVQKRPPI